MLDLLRGRNGHNHSKTGVSEPTITEILPTPGLEQSNPHDGLTSQQAALLSPTPSVANFLSVSKRQTSSARVFGSVRASHGRFTNSLVREEHSIVRHKCELEFGSNVSEHVFNTSFTGLLEWIRSERMVTLPHKGGTWDRVLIAAQYFAEQVHHFNRHIETFTEDSGAATNFVFGQCLLLLGLGHENGSALEKAFDLFYQFGLELSPLIRRADLFHESHTIMEGVGRAFADLLQIVAGTSITFHQAVNSGRPFTKIDIFASFSVLIDTFRLRIHRCSHEMWNAAFTIRNSDGCQVDVLQKWLAPQDSVLAFLSSNHINLACRPEQFTCNWFQSHLTSFFKSHEKILLVEGKSGSGKTTLASWAVNRLQRQIARKHVSTISFFFDPSVVAQSTPLAMLRVLLNQLLSIRIGNLRLFEAVNEAYMKSQKLDADEQETMMWQAFSKALQAVGSEDEDGFAIVIDGVVESDSTMQQSYKKLQGLAQKHAGIRLIQFSQPLSQKPSSSVRVKLSLENILDDIRTVIRRRLHTYEHFRDREVGDQESIIEQIAIAADGSMLWSYLACKLLQRQSSCKGFDETMKTLTTSSVTVPEVIKKLYVSLDLHNDCKVLLSLLVIAARPLRVVETEALLSTVDKSIDVRSMLNHLSSLAIIHEGMVSIRHSAVRQAILGLTVDAYLAQNLKTAHQDMLTRLFTSTKSSLRVEQEPTLTLLEESQAESRLQSHPLLEYSIRYWTLHFRKSPFFKAQGDPQLPEEFKSILSSSVNLCLLEQACWSAQSFLKETIEMHMLAFRVRRTLFGQNHACVLQSALYCATIWEKIPSHLSEAGEWYALAAKISSVVVGVQADITITCCNMLLRISETLITKKRTMIMTYREETLLILVSSYKHRYGSSSKEVLEIYQKLHELYVHLEEETKIAEVLEIIQKLTISIYGSHSHEAQLISRNAQVLLRPHERKPVVDTMHGFLFHGYSEEKEELTFLWIQRIIESATEFISRGKFYRAEEHYIELWLKLSEHCHTVHAREWHEKKIEVMLIYAEFLRIHKRESEAGAILVAIWTEYEHHEFCMFESVIALLKKMAVCLRELKLLTTALLVLNKCYWFFKHQHQEQSVIFLEISELISLTSIEISVESTTISIDTSSETVIRAVFESSFASTESVSITTLKLCESLITIYQKEERWSEAVICIKKTLLMSWSTFFSESFENINMTEKFSCESIKLAVSLAACYLSMKRYQKAEEIYVRLYRYHRNHLKIDNVTVIEYKDELVRFYAKHEMFTKAISFYQELLVEYRAHFGGSHEWTIKVLYALGGLCRQHSTNYGYWLEYYLEIIVNLNKGNPICHERAFDALMIVAEHYYETLRYSESLVYFKSIFATFCKLHRELKYFEEVVNVKILIEHYFRSIEESKTELSIHIEILKELREACCKYYKESHEITINVTLALAETCCKSEEYQFKALTFYESVMKYESTVSEEIVKRTEVSLRTLYVKQIDSKTITVTKETIERATEMVYKSYIEVRQRYSCSHEITLAHLRELVMLYHKQQKLELALKELKLVIVDCILKVTSAQELIEAATFLAGIYTKCGFVIQGIEIIRELKLQIIYKKTERCTHVKFEVIPNDRACFAFIAAFEYHLRAIYSISLTLYMSDLVAEYLFYERLVEYTKTKAQLENVLVCGSRLHQILVRTKRVQDFFIIEEQVCQYFISSEAAVMKIISKESAKIFIGIVLGHLSKYSVLKSWTAAVGHAAVDRLKVLLREHKFKEALNLTTCTFHFLMAHEGLDDETEITLGFELCLMMAGRANDQSLNHKCGDPVVHKGMMDLSRRILGEVFDICKTMRFNLARCQISELDSLITLVGEQKDYVRLQWLLEILWSSREGQTKWSADTMLNLGKRLVQAQFATGHNTSAIRLCENIVYNIRRVHGVRHHYTVTFQNLLASMYITLALKYLSEAASNEKANKKRAEEMARVYFKKAIQVHEDVLKQIVNADDADMSDYDDDESEYNDMTSTHRGATNGDAACGFAWLSREQEIECVKAHVRKLQLAIQCYGGWIKPSGNYEALTNRVWVCYAKEPAFDMTQEQVLSNKWKVDADGSGKAEAGVEEDGFEWPND